MSRDGGTTGGAALGETGSQPADEACEVPDADPELPDVPEPEQADDCGRPAGKFRTMAKKLLPFLIALGAVSVAITSAGGIHEGELKLPGAVEVHHAHSDAALVVDELRYLGVQDGGEQGENGGDRRE